LGQALIDSRLGIVAKTCMARHGATLSERPENPTVRRHSIRVEGGRHGSLPISASSLCANVA
jgi:hypothetical protein